MFTPRDIVLEAFIDNLKVELRNDHPSVEAPVMLALEEGVRVILTQLARSDALYTNFDTALTVGSMALRVAEGRQVAEGDVAPEDLLHFLLAALGLYLGFVRDLLPGDGPEDVDDGLGGRLALPLGGTDGTLLPSFNARSQAFLRRRFAEHPVIDGDRLARWVGAVPFPETGAEAAPASTWARLLRGAHSLSLAADPAFIQRMPRLFRQLEEVGLAKKLGYGHGDDIVAAYPRLFWGPMMEMTASAMRYLRFTAQGKHWLSRVHAQMLVLEHAELQG